MFSTGLVTAVRSGAPALRSTSSQPPEGIFFLLKQTRSPLGSTQCRSRSLRFRHSSEICMSPDWALASSRRSFISGGGGGGGGGGGTLPGTAGGGGADAPPGAG